MSSSEECHCPPQPGFFGGFRIEGSKTVCNRCGKPWPGHKPTDAGVPEAQKHRGAHQIMNPPADAPRHECVNCGPDDVAHTETGVRRVVKVARKADVKRYTLQEIAQTVIPADKPAWVSIESYASLESDNASLRASLAEFKGDYGKLVDLEGQAQARVAALEADNGRLREALTELRSCSRAKIGMEDDFACADAQMRQALNPTFEAEL